MSEVYFVQPLNGGPIRIGATQDCAARAVIIGSWHPNGVEILATVQGHFHREAVLHNLLRPLRMRRDWFRSCATLWRLIIDVSEGRLQWLPREASDSEIAAEQRTFRARVFEAFGSYEAFAEAVGLKSKQAVLGFCDYGWRPSKVLFGALVARELVLRQSAPDYLLRLFELPDDALVESAAA